MGKIKDIRAAVEDELSFDPLVDAADITVRNMGGDVALTGTVPSYPQYLEAAAAARRVARVTSVHNHLEVVLPPSGCTVTLTGHVRNWAEHDAVVAAAWMANGVSDVRDELSVTG